MNAIFSNPGAIVFAVPFLFAALPTYGNHTATTDNNFTRQAQRLAQKDSFNTADFILAQNCIKNGSLLSRTLYISLHTLDNKGRNMAEKAIREQDLELLLSYARLTNNKKDIIDGILEAQQYDFLVRFLEQDKASAALCPVSLLFDVLSSAKRDSFIQLLHLTGNANAINKDKSPLLCIAIREGDTEAVRELLQMKANPNIGKSADSTPLLCAIEAKDEEIVELLLDAGADVNCGVNTAPLIEAVKQNNLPLVQLLIDKGANVNIVRNTTPLMLSLQKQQPEICRYLLEHGADIKHEFKDGLTAADCIMSMQYIPDKMFNVISPIKSELQKEEETLRREQELLARQEAQKALAQQQKEERERKAEQKRKEQERITKQKKIFSQLPFLTNARPKLNARYYAFIHLPAYQDSRTEVMCVWDEIVCSVRNIYINDDIQIIAICHDESKESALKCPKEKKINDIPIILNKDFVESSLEHVTFKNPDKYNTKVTVVDGNFTIVKATSCYWAGKTACKEISFLAFKLGCDFEQGEEYSHSSGEN